MSDLETLRNLELAPYILKATTLIGVERKVGGNQFRHSFATLGILLDYKYYNDSVLLKAALLHDILEERPDTKVEEIQQIDSESQQVAQLILEVTRLKHESKPQYLQRVLDHGSKNALILKCADRISNLTDLHRDTHSKQKISRYLDETEQYVFKMAIKTNKYMLIELRDLVDRRREIL
ncbi:MULTISPECIES: HD domain-containing protein [unclassified Saccharicrinis]|uniref:HD domain-containing protein n=1 Tax=unclassified Saccharicrinis TaxID=2646859 RepID=UPI003D352BC9